MSQVAIKEIDGREWVMLPKSYKKKAPYGVRIRQAGAVIEISPAPSPSRKKPLVATPELEEKLAETLHDRRYPVTREMLREDQDAD